jgi:hypothetical protein
LGFRVMAFAFRSRVLYVCTKYQVQSTNIWVVSSHRNWTECQGRAAGCGPDSLSGHADFDPAGCRIGRGVGCNLGKELAQRLGVPYEPVVFAKK